MTGPFLHLLVGLVLLAIMAALALEAWTELAARLAVAL